MLAITDALTHTITVQAGTQIVKSELLINAACYYIHQDPASILFVQPTQSLAEDFSKERFAPTRDATEVIRDLVPDARNRDSGVTITHKEYPGGTLDFVGANSPSDLASRPKRIILADEVDKYPISAGNEGDPLTLAEERASTFWNRKSVRCCSPTYKETSRIYREYLLSDQRKCFVPCPHCNESQPLEWAQVRWPKDDDGNHLTDRAEYQCKQCGAFWTEGDRVRALRSVVDLPDRGWRQTKAFRCCGVDQKPQEWTPEGRSICVECRKPVPFNGHAGFVISKIYSTRHRLADGAAKFISAQGDPEKLKTFFNTWLAETWEEQGEAVEAAGLRSNCEQYGSSDLPDGVHFATAGVDVQGDRLECEIVGWGAGDESWGIRYEVLYGDPAQDAVWKELDSLLLEKFWTEGGRLVRVRSACIDTGGHHSAQVLKFCRARAARLVYPIKGASGPRPVWPKRASKTGNTKENIWIVGVDTAKDAIYGRFKIKWPKEHRGPVPGYCHLPGDYDDDWFEQATSEKVVTRYKEGRPFRVWVLEKGKRNEALDCRVYAFAARMSLDNSKTRPSTVKQERVAADDAVTIAADDIPKPPPPVVVQTMKQRPMRRMRSRGIF